MALTNAQQVALATLTAEKLKVTQAQQAYATANPQGAMADQVQQDQQTLRSSYSDPTQRELDQALFDCLEAGVTLTTLQTVAGPSQDYTRTLQEKADRLTAEQSQLTQKIRTQRRSFMDAFPQGGTGGKWGIPHTADDFAMLLFFLGFVATYSVAFSKFVPSSSYKVWIGILGFLIAWIAVNRALLYLG